MVSTAESIDPWAVMMTTRVHGLWASRSGTKSSPDESPSRRSTNARSNGWRAASATASAALLTALTTCPSASSPIASDLRMLISSSTTKTRSGRVTLAGRSGESDEIIGRSNSTLSSGCRHDWPMKRTTALKPSPSTGKNAGGKAVVVSRTWYCTLRHAK